MSQNVQTPEPIRVAHVITGLQTGGAEAMLNKLVQSERGSVDAIVIALTPGGKYQKIIEDSGISVHILNFKQLWKLPWLLFQLFRLIQQHRTQIVHAWMYHAVFFTSVAQWICFRKQARPSFIWNIRHSLKDIKQESRSVQLLIKLLSFLVFLPSKVVFNSMQSAKEHQRFWSIASKIHFLPNGFELDVWQPMPAAGENKLRNLLNIAEGFIFINVARAHPMKNQQGLIRAFQELAYAGDALARVHLVLLGKGTQELPGVLSTENIHGLGERNDIAQLLPGADCFVLSSNWGEGFPNVLGEAMACGLPCITTNVGDSAMLLNQREWVVEPYDDRAILQTLKNMLSLATSQRERLGVCNQRRVQDNFEIEQVAKQYVALYQQIVA